MADKDRPFVIALEEHYWDAEVAKTFESPEARNPALRQRLDDLGALRIKEMDEAGIDVQVISHGAPSTQKLPAEIAAELARRVNDRLHAAVKAHPTRFAAFAALPTADPKAAADELERTTGLGFKGAMIHGLTNGVFHDDKRFWPIYERAQALDVPLYMHPGIPQPAIIETYYKEYIQQYPNILRAAWGFTVETATQAIRMILGGVFEAHPQLKIILGHLGEGLPFYLWRINMGLTRDGAGPTWFRDTFSEHFWITTSGFFSDPALICCMMEMGIDRILFSIDYPFVDNQPGAKWLETLPLSGEDKEKLLNGNVKRLLKM